MVRVGSGSYHPFFPKTVLWKVLLTMKIFILWGEQFDEELAITFLCRLRAAGLVTKLVGVQGRTAAGQYGSLLCSDLTLGEALPLAHQSVGVLIPCHSPQIRQLDLDPRIERFLRTCHAHGAPLFTGRLAPADAATLSLTPHRIQTCADRTTYGTMADRLVNRLAGALQQPTTDR